MKKIKLTQNKYALVDDKDFEVLSKFSWYARWNNVTKGFYAVRGIKTEQGKRRTIWMHREIMDTPKEMTTDHINHDGLDNRRKNLRICTRAENNLNRRKSINNKSGLKGVYWRKDVNKWQAQISFNGSSIYIGLFSIKEKAGIAYNKFAKKYHGEFALLNN